MNLIIKAWAWLNQPIPLVEPAPIKANVITDYLKLRGERLISLRNKAIEEDNIFKKKQADYLISQVNEEISKRYFFNNFRFN